MATIFAEHHCDTRQAGQLYDAWRTKGSPAIRNRNFWTSPSCFSKTQRQAEEKAPAGTGLNYYAIWKWLAASVNRAQRRLAGAVVTELDDQQKRKPHGTRLKRIQKGNSAASDEEILPEKKPHVEPSATQPRFWN